MYGDVIRSIIHVVVIISRKKINAGNKTPLSVSEVNLYLYSEDISMTCAPLNQNVNMTFVTFAKAK